MSNDGPYTRDELGQFAPSGTDAQKKAQTTARAKKIQKLHQLQALLASAQAAGVDAGAQGLIKSQIASLVKSANRPATARAGVGAKVASRVSTPAAKKPKKSKKAKHKKSKKGTAGKKVKK